MYNCDFFVCFRTYLFVRALLAKIVKLRRHRKPVRNLWSRFELDPSTVARVPGAQSFFFPGVDKTISRGFSKIWSLAPVVDRSWCRCRFHPLPGAASSFSDM